MASAVRAPVLVSGKPFEVQARSPSFYRPELDILRFFAFFAVFLTHALPHDAAAYVAYHLPNSLIGLATSVAVAGAFGVPLFFLLSAYLITSLLLRERANTGTVHLRSFYVRRILRIWPLYFFALFVAALWPMKSIRLPLNYFWGYLLLAGNWMSFALGAPISFVSVLWSVSIEEQFYLLWPLAVRLSSRRAMLYTSIGLIAVANVVRPLMIFWGHVHPLALYYSTFTHLGSIAMGILCALYLPERLRFPRVPLLLARVMLLIAGLALWIVCGHYFHLAPVAIAVVGYTAIALGALFIFLSIYGLPLHSAVLQYLGKISYGLYVYHFFALYVMGLLHFHLIPHFVGGLLLTVLLAAVSYRWLESPFLRIKERFSFVRSRPV